MHLCINPQRKASCSAPVYLDALQNLHNLKYIIVFFQNHSCIPISCQMLQIQQEHLIQDFPKASSFKHQTQTLSSSKDFWNKDSFLNKTLSPSCFLRRTLASPVCLSILNNCAGFTEIMLYHLLPNLMTWNSIAYF